MFGRIANYKEELDRYEQTIQKLTEEKLKLTDQVADLRNYKILLGQVLNHLGTLMESKSIDIFGSDVKQARAVKSVGLIFKGFLSSEETERLLKEIENDFQLERGKYTLENIVQNLICSNWEERMIDINKKI